MAALAPSSPFLVSKEKSDTAGASLVAALGSDGPVGPDPVERTPDLPGLPLSEGSPRGRHRRQFSPGFKREVVELVRSSGRPVAQVARELGAGRGLRDRQVRRPCRSDLRRAPETAEAGCQRACAPLSARSPLRRSWQPRPPDATGSASEALALSQKNTGLRARHRLQTIHV